MDFRSASWFESLEPRQLLSTVRIMPLGDSITESFAPRESYRYWLWNTLQQNQYDVDFVGSQHGVRDGAPADGNFDQDHEGHSGWKADQILQNIDTWAATFKPDIVLMHLGTNDIHAGESNSSTIDQLGQIIDHLRQANPNVTVIVSKLIPSVSYADTSALDALIPALVAAKNTATSRVLGVDPTPGFSVSSDLFDGLHPSASGEQKIASAFYGALHDVLPDPNEPPPPPPPPAPTPAPLPPGMTSLTNLPWTSATNGTGPVERDSSNGEAAAGDGTTIRIRSRKYIRGLGVSSNSRIDFRINGRQRWFASDFGIDNEVGSGGSVTFKVYADGKRIFSSQIITSATPVQGLKLDIRGVRKLTLIVNDAGNGSAADHADWADPRVLKS